MEYGVHGETSFAFGTGVIACLYIVVIKCRDRSLRRKALSLLEDHPRREGVWDSCMAVAVTRRVTEMEEEGLAEGEVVPEEKRLRVLEIKTPSSKREAVIKCTKMGGPSARERYMVPDHVVTW